MLLIRHDAEFTQHGHNSITQESAGRASGNYSVYIFFICMASLIFTMCTTSIMHWNGFAYGFSNLPLLRVCLVSQEAVESKVEVQ